MGRAFAPFVHKTCSSIKAHPTHRFSINNFADLAAASLFYPVKYVVKILSGPLRRDPVWHYGALSGRRTPSMLLAPTTTL
jgi:hypothetical protein